MGTETAMEKGEKPRAALRRRGATVVEYSLMLAMIAVVLIIAVSALAQTLKGGYGKCTAAVDDAVTQSNTAAP